MVSAYNLLETFVAERLGELAAHINGGTTQFLDLPERLQRRSITNTISVANAQQRWGNLEIVELRAQSAAIGSSLSAVGNTLELSPLTWLWPGSNMGAADFATALSFLHVKKPWDDVRRLAGRMGFPVVDPAGNPLDYSTDLTALAKERHRCAHVAGYGITTVWLRSVPDRVMRYAVTFDGLASASANRMRKGDPPILNDEKWMTDAKIALRFVRQRARDFAEFVEGGTKAFRRGTDFDSVWVAAQGRCGAMEVLARQTAGGGVVDWCIPSVD